MSAGRCEFTRKFGTGAGFLLGYFGAFLLQPVMENAGLPSSSVNAIGVGIMLGGALGGYALQRVAEESVIRCCASMATAWQSWGSSSDNALLDRTGDIELPSVP